VPSGKITSDTVFTEPRGGLVKCPLCDLRVVSVDRDHAHGTHRRSEHRLVEQLPLGGVACRRERRHQRGDVCVAPVIRGEDVGLLRIQLGQPNHLDPDADKPIRKPGRRGEDPLAIAPVRADPLHPDDHPARDEDVSPPDEAVQRHTPSPFR
jgi:hypothetical protein